MLFYEMTGFMPGHGGGPEENRPIEFPRPEDAVLLLDFDGTLVDIAERPTDVVVPDRVPALLARAMERLDGRVALVSGRTIADLEAFLPDFGGALVGTHGAEARIDGARSQPQDFDRGVVERLQRIVGDFVALRPEFLVERKPSGVVLHYRQAEAQAGLALRFMESLAAASDGFRLQPALMAYELKPDSVGKDMAAELVLSLPGHGGKIPVFAGDDLTDEAAIGVVQARGGIGIKVGEAETTARYRIADPAALLESMEVWLA